MEVDRDFEGSWARRGVRSVEWDVMGGSDIFESMYESGEKLGGRRQ